MGAWSHEPFGNDTACDWAYELDDVQDLTVIESALDMALASADYLEAPEGEEALAAIEVVAKLMGQGTQNDTYTEGVDAWVQKNAVKPDEKLLEKCSQILHLLCSDRSELMALWAGDSNWVGTVKQLMNQVSES